MLINFDKKGAEWIVVAHLCQDPAMLDVVRSGKSPHVVTGARISGLTEAQVLAEFKLIDALDTADPAVIDATRREHLPDILTASFLPRTMAIRQAAKKANHGLNYGEGYKTFALKNEMDEREARKIVALYNEIAYPGIPLWRSATEQTLRKTRTLTNCFGRKCYFMGQIGDDMFRDGYAFVPQSTVSDSVTQAQAAFLDDDRDFFRPAQLLANGHDSLLFQYLSHDFLAMARFAIAQGLGHMSPTLDYGTPFTLETEMKIGFSYGAMREIKHFTPDEAALAQQLQEAYDALRAAPAKAA